MRKNGKDKFYIVHTNYTQDEVEAVVHFAITSPPRREYLVWTKRESAGKDKDGKNLIITYISRVEENKNGVQTLKPITDEDEFARCRQVIKEIIEQGNEET